MDFASVILSVINAPAARYELKHCPDAFNQHQQVHRIDFTGQYRLMHIHLKL